MMPAPAAPAACLYVGTVLHARLRPLAHRFRYRVASLLVDVDRLGEADRASPAFSVGRFNLFSFYERDHGPATGAPLRPYIDALMRQAGVDLDGGRVLLLCYPRMLGYVFNPLSVYYCYGADGELAALLYEVRNTFGERHSYVAPVRAGERSATGVRQECDKLFYVSPFLPMALRYKFRLTDPQDEVSLRILECDAEGPLFAAAFRGERRPLASAALLRTALAMPMLTLKIVAAIHWEAFVLWWRGLPILARPAAPAAASLDGSALRQG